MTSKANLQVLFAYHWHTTNQLAECAARLSASDYAENPGYGHGSLQDLFFHLLRTDVAWRVALQTGRQQAGIKAGDYPDLDSLRQGFESEKQAWQELLENLSEGDIQADIELTNWRGEPFVFPRWRILQHVVLHGMQHHAELAQLLTTKGQSPGNIDFLFYG